MQRHCPATTSLSIDHAKQRESEEAHFLCIFEAARWNIVASLSLASGAHTRSRAVLLRRGNGTSAGRRSECCSSRSSTVNHARFDVSGQLPTHQSPSLTISDPIERERYDNRIRQAEQLCPAQPSLCSTNIGIGSELEKKQLSSPSFC